MSATNSAGNSTGFPAVNLKIIADVAPSLSNTKDTTRPSWSLLRFDTFCLYITYLSKGLFGFKGSFERRYQ